MFIGERGDELIAKALLLDGLSNTAAAKKLGRSRPAIIRARKRINRNLAVLGLDKLPLDDRRAMIQRLVENASGLTSSAA